MKTARIVGLAAVAAALAGCVSTMGGPTLSGSWMSEDSKFVSTFNNGRFDTVVLATKERVANGQYAPSPRGYQLSWTNIRNEPKSATCELVNPKQLSCQPAAGAPFLLNRVG